MSEVVTIGGVDVDSSDPCQVYQALYAAKLKMLAGEHVEETMIRSPATQRMVRLSPANMAGLDRELMRLSAACEAKNGKRTRFARTITFC